MFILFIVSFRVIEETLIFDLNSIHSLDNKNCVFNYIHNHLIYQVSSKLDQKKEKLFPCTAI